VAGETAAPLEGRIDPNIAEWYDLTRLPRVGEGLARRVVAYRQAKIQEWREAHPNEPAEQAPRVFAHAEDLRSIKGIGPKTLEQLRPFLRFDATTTLPADGSN
jgi:DNA uptake protein ComE-like DNA-binding protein